MSPSSPAQSAQKVLVVEGNGAFGESLAKALTTAGYAATLAKTGTDGMKLIYDVLPHLILLDTDLPGMSGYDILAKKQSEPLLAKIPVFLMSTNGAPISMRQVPQGAVAEYVISFHGDASDIVGKVDRYFGHPIQQSAASPTAGSPARKKILWVEDDKLIGTILAKKLISSGFDLIHAKNGEEALEALKTIVPDVVVLDLILPGMSGFDILQKIRVMDGQLNDAPVMILSNLSKPSDIDKAKALGAKKFLVKAAASLDEIVAEIRGLCS